jgi:hypothetical protein
MGKMQILYCDRCGVLLRKPAPLRGQALCDRCHEGHGPKRRRVRDSGAIPAVKLRAAMRMGNRKP